MQGLPIALFAATGLSGLLAFGVIQSAFSQQAQALFYVFAALLLLMFATSKVFGGGDHGKSHGHGKAHGHGAHDDHAVKFSGRAVGTIMMAAGALTLVYFWTDNELTAEKIGRQIDGGVYALGQQAQARYADFIDGEEASDDEIGQPVKEVR